MIIDFASAQAADVLIDYSVQKEIPVVICTTGLSEEQIERIEAAAQKTAVLRSANMSMGINILMDLLKKAAKVLDLIWRSWKNTIIRKWMHRAERHWH